MFLPILFIDFFVTLGVNSSFALFNIPHVEKFKNKEELIQFLCEYTYIKFDFEKIPDSYKFNGTSALYSRLNSCFGIDSNEIKDIIQELNLLTKEGFKIKQTEQKLTPNQIINMYNYINTRYKNIYNNKEIILHISSLLKLQFCPSHGITNCLCNMLTYVSSKKDFLTYNTFSNQKILNELKYDESCDVAFKYAVAILKSSVINCAIECSEFKDIDFSMINTSKINIDNILEFDIRKNNYTSEDMSDYEAPNKVKMEISRNALAHGVERLNVDIKPGLGINLTDIYHKVSPISANIKLKHLNKILSLEIFKPRNIKVKEKSKVLVKK